MEKRLLLAVFLSMVVVFVFQGVFGSKTQTSRNLQTIDSVDVIDKKAETETSGKTVFEAKALQEQEQLAKEELFVDQANGFDITFSTQGGNIVDVKIPKYKYTFLVNKPANLKQFEYKKFEYKKISSTHYEMVYEGEGLRVSKEYIFKSPFSFDILIEVKNISESIKTTSAEIKTFNVDLSRLDKNKRDADWTLFEYSIKTDKSIIRKDNVNNFNEKWNKEEALVAKWLGFRDRYFASIVEPEKPFEKYFVKYEDETKLNLGGIYPTETMAPGQIKSYRFNVYFGPQDLASLKESKPEFEKIMVFSNWGWLDAISKGIYWILGTLHKIFPSWGLCIIFISLIVYGAMYPLTAKSLVSMKKMQSLQPKMAELKKKYEKNPEKMNQEVMDLYRRNGVNPLSGCLPMLLQMPIFVGLYQVLWRSFYFRGEGFLWMKDLSMPDQLFKLPFSIPFLGEYFNILPILMAIIMFFQQKMNMSNVSSMDQEQQMQQKMMAYFMPVFLGFIFYNFSSGLCVYFVVFYALSGYSQWHIAKNMKEVV